MILNKINDRIAGFDGSLGISYLDINTGDRLRAGNCDVFPSDGLARLLVLLEAFRRMDAGEMSPADVYVLAEEDFPPVVRGKRYCSALRQMHVGASVTMEDLYRLSTVVGDEMAYRILLRTFTAESVNQTMAELGFSKSRINRGPELVDGEKKELQNTISVEEMASLFYRLALGQVFSGDASGQMLGILEQYQQEGPLSYYFEEGLPIAHQSGRGRALVIDAGVVYGQAPFVLSMAAFTEEPHQAEAMLRDITLMCYKNSIDASRA